jgi:nitronate monooxygenase
MDLAALREPIVQAPLAGGVSTPELAAAVSTAGGLGFLAAGYKTPEAAGEDISTLRSLTAEPFGINIFAPPSAAAETTALKAYGARLRAEAERYHVALGAPRHDDDGFEAKVKLAADRGVPVVSFTFGCPGQQVVERLHDAGCDVWVTITTPREAVEAQAAGADALVVQGFEAGGHRAYFTNEPEAYSGDESETEDFGLLIALRLVARQVKLPLIGAGGIADGPSVAAVLCAGAVAAQIGTALMLTPEAGTSAPHRSALSAPGRTRLTRAFSGRQARGIVNRFLREHSAAAPAAYPDVHHLTAPIRAAARAAGDPDAINLWAGQAHTLAQAAPAAQIVRRLGAQAREAARLTAERLGPPSSE